MKYFPNQAKFQTLFNTSYAHILKQGKPSVKGEGDDAFCVYRGDNGCSCAAAPFIKNYKPEMERHQFLKLSEDFYDDLDPVAVQCAHFVNQLQYAHDDIVNSPPAEFINRYKDKMRILASQYDLEFPA